MLIQRLSYLVVSSVWDNQQFCTPRRPSSQATSTLATPETSKIATVFPIFVSICAFDIAQLFLDLLLVADERVYNR